MTGGAAERLARGHYENFAVLSPLVSGEMRRDFATVYAFCRGVDDAGDRVGVSEASRLEELSRWRAAVRGVWEGDGGGAFDEVGVAGLWDRLGELVGRRGLRVEPFEDLIGAFERDQRQTVYESWEDLRSYCAKSAVPVGRIVLALGGVDGRDGAAGEVVRMSDLVCTGLQLANMWQDVRRDLLELGRVYLPTGETGLGRAELMEMVGRGDDPAARVRFIRALRPMVDRTRDEFFGPSLGLARLLRERGGGAGGLAGPVWLFRGGGLAALDAVERVGCATLWRRPRVGSLRRARLLAGAWVRFGLR